MKQDLSRRLVIAHNPHSARAKTVQSQVFDRLDAAGYLYETIEVQQAHLDDNVTRLAPLIKPNDIVLSAAGDGSAHAVAHTIIKANQPGVWLGFLAFGNFNDVANTFNGKESLVDPVSLLENSKPEEIKPLSVVVDGAPLRNALLYFTLGWTARAANRFDDPKLRHKIKHGGAGLIKSLWHLGWYYLQTRRNSEVLEFTLGGSKYKGTDIIAANGPTVARLFKTGQHYYRRDDFLFKTLNIRWLLPNTLFLISGLVGKMKGQKIQEAELVFASPVDVIVQCDGEVVNLENTTKIEVIKSDQSITVLSSKAA